ncbi:MAG: diaminopimelate epimerase [Bacteroidales bacterium]|nr:diaminopimelate epimerase [Bacteroidales bacterium]MBN2762754.1 diaminopimelate epimerase [Bacteroidales bacterium]
MLLNFSKYQGAGNDFIIVDNRDNNFPRSDKSLVARLCDRKFGIGADGLMLLQNAATGHDFEMVYFNSDGRESTMCGNGGRCIAAFAARLQLIEKETTFLAADGMHEAILLQPETVRLHMTDVDKVEKNDAFCFLNTGSPHYVKFVTDAAGINVYHEGMNIRYSNRFKEQGTNVNFVQDMGDSIFVRTYERGVENETLSCGTGIVASAISSYLQKNTDEPSFTIPVSAPGGKMVVSFDHKNGKFTNIWLEGPAIFVFEGKIETTRLSLIFDL